MNFVKVIITESETDLLLFEEFIRHTKIDRWLDKKIRKCQWGDVSEYNIEIDDKNGSFYNLNQVKAIIYLKNTDWLIIREVDVGVEAPADIISLREEARAIL
jgi:hypothetical protein